MKTNKTLLSLVTAAAVAGALSMAYAEADPAAPLTPVENGPTTQEATPMTPPRGDFTGSQSSGTTTTTVESPTAPVATVSEPSNVAYTEPAPAPAPAPMSPEPVSTPVDNTAPTPAPMDNSASTMPAPQADRN